MKKALKGCIYLIRNLVNGKGYVGQHKNVNTVEDVRWKSHIVAALEKKSRYPVHCAIRKYGIKKFSAEVIWVGPVELLNKKEMHYIKKLHTFIDDLVGPGGYNLTTGGNQKTSFSSKSRSKMSAGQYRRFTDPAEGAKHSVKMKKLYESEEARAKVSVGLSRYYVEHPEAIPVISKKATVGNKKRYEDPEQRSKTSRASKCTWANPVHRETITASLRRPEVRAKISKTLSATLTELYKDPVERAKKSVTLIRAYAENPDYRKNVSAGNRRRYEDPEERRKTGERSKIAWARKTSEERSAIALRGAKTRKAKC